MELKSISKSFNGKKILDDISLEVNDGECVMLMGVSGRGKTTLLRIMMGLSEPDSGVISGRPEKMSAVFQEDRLPPDFTLYRSIKAALPKSIKKELIEERLSELGLSEQLDKPVRLLSGGMKRRAAVCRALLCEFDTLFLDEPFTGLDAESKEKTAEHILKYAKGKTVILVSHAPEDARLMGARVTSI